MPREQRAVPHLGEVLEFLRVIWEVDHALRATSRWMERAIGITGPQRLVVRIVGRFPGIPAGSLARILRVHASTLTGTLTRLEHAGIVSRRSDPRDGRRALLGLTARGRALDAERPGTIESAVQRVLAGLPQAKVDAAREVLTGLAAALRSEATEAATTKLPTGRTAV